MTTDRDTMFDPYHKWLGIPKHQRPPTFYQLLGVSPDEEDPEVIEEAALMRVAHVRNYQLGPHAEECSRLLHELGEAGATLSDPGRRAAYDAELKAKTADATVAAPVPLTVSTSSPVERDVSPPPAESPVSPERADPVPLDVDDMDDEPSQLVPSTFREDAGFRERETPRPHSLDQTPPGEFAFERSSRRPYTAREIVDHPRPPDTAGIRRDNPYLRELSKKAVRELREPIPVEEETLWTLARDLIRESAEQIPPEWVPYLRRACRLALLGLGVWLVLRVAGGFF